MYVYDDDDFDVPEFMFGRKNICMGLECTKEIPLGKTKCLDCEVEANLSRLYSEIDDITKKGR